LRVEGWYFAGVLGLAEISRKEFIEAYEEILNI